MNKYKDALNELFVYSKHSANKVEILSLIKCYEKLEQLINEHFELKEKYEKLVDKATPKKPINKTVEKTGKHAVGKWARGYYDTIDHIVCPHCGKRLKVNGKPHCDKCGGALDWGEEDD